MITIDSYFMGRDKQFPDELTQEIKDNASDLVVKVQKLLSIWGGTTWVSSGWRPAAVNSKVPNAAKKSNHMTGKAVDLVDKQGRLDEWCMANLKVLEDLGLYLEDPAATPTWCHIQSCPPKSGRRVFKP